LRQETQGVKLGVYPLDVFQLETGSNRTRLGTGKTTAATHAHNQPRNEKIQSFRELGMKMWCEPGQKLISQCLTGIFTLLVYLTGEPLTFVIESLARVVESIKSQDWRREGKFISTT
jgi:hypothetical protein